MENIEKVRLIASNKDCEIFEITYGQNKIRSCVKILKCYYESQLQHAIHELTMINKVSHLKMSLRVLKHFVESPEKNNDKFKVLKIITEYCSGGNLSQYISRRKNQNKPFKYPELKAIFYSLIEYFAALQEAGISHRDIKPDNILLTEKEEIKICDFGSSKTMIIENELTNTITGSPFFLSPELREGYNKYLSRMGGNYTEYNPFKSDVFSLGLVFLFYIDMEKINCDPLNFEAFNACIKENINKIKYYNIKILLSHMLAFDQSNRPDFREIFNIFKEIFNNKLCFICKQSNDKPQVTCQECETSFHSQCLQGRCCQNCESEQTIKCQNCKQMKFLKCASHGLCENCAISNTGCSECYGFEVFQSPRCEFSFYSCKFNCYLCKSTVNPKASSRNIECSNCEVIWCQLCKRQAHESACSDDPSQVELYCPCGGFHSFSFNSIFYECPNQGSLCLVCMKNANEGHWRCSCELNRDNAS